MPDIAKLLENSGNETEKRLKKEMVYNPINFGAKIIQNWKSGIRHCEDCPLRREGWRYTPIGSLGYEKSDILFVAQNPGAPGRRDCKGKCLVNFLGKNKEKKEENLQIALIHGWKNYEYGGNFPKIFTKILESGFKRACFTNVARCSHLKSKKITKVERRAYKKCSKYLEEEIEQMNPKLIVALGVEASKAVYRICDKSQSTSHPKNLKDRYGKKVDVGKYYVISVYHPTGGQRAYNRYLKKERGKDYEEDLRDILRENLCNL